MTQAVKIDERVVVEAWERQAFNHAPLQRLGLKVLFRGVPSDAGGPDYQDALLTTEDRTLIVGDVEFHLRASDWVRHGHHKDPRYNNVVLHVVWTDDIEQTRRQDGQVVRTLPVGGGESLVEVESSDRSSMALLPHPCVDAFGEMSRDELRAGIQRGGELRFLERKNRFAADIEATEADQVAYSAILQALGYASNAEMFCRLAEAVPFAWLQSIPRGLWAHALLDAAGLGPRCVVAVPGRLAASGWRLARLRPGNHPARRLAGAAHLMTSSQGPLSEFLRERVMIAGKAREVTAFLQVRIGEESPIGVGRARELSVSVVLPFVAALEPASSKPFTLFSAHASPPRNKWTRLMESRIRMSGHLDFKMHGALEHQGLHFLYHRFCRPERFNSCVCCGELRARNKGGSSDG